MLLESLSIKNFRSLENVKLEGLQRFSVLIGRNNSGKSSVFGALTLLNSVIWGTGVDWGAVLTEKNSQLSLEIELSFQLSEADRDDLISNICKLGQWISKKSRMTDGPFCRSIKYTFRSPVGQPQLLHLREIKFLAEDNSWQEWQKMISDENGGITGSTFADWQETTRHQVFEINSTSFSQQNRRIPLMNRQLNIAFGQQVQGSEVVLWPMRELANYFKRSYFFNPFRHSTPVLPVLGVNQLSRNGENLAQVIHAIHSDNRKQFHKIEKFIHGALPEIGDLQTPLLN